MAFSPTPANRGRVILPPGLVAVLRNAEVTIVDVLSEPDLGQLCDADSLQGGDLNSIRIFNVFPTHIVADDRR
jgi:hypothetical protein